MRKFIVYVAMLPIVGLLSGPAVGEEGVLKSRNVHHNVLWEKLDIPDEKGHIVGLYENAGVSMHDNGEIAELVIRGTLDRAGDKGAEEGYEIRTYPDGSTIVLRYTGQPTDAAGNSAGTLTCIEGTGRYKGITCEGNYTGGPHADMRVYDTELSYELEK